MTQGNNSGLLEENPEIERYLYQRQQTHEVHQEPTQTALFEQEVNIEIETQTAKQNKQQRTLFDYTRLGVLGTQSSIVRPVVQAKNFELKLQLVQMVQQLATFNSLTIPNIYLENFLEVCDILKINGVSDDAIQLRAFPFSLKGKAKQWLQSLPHGSIRTRDQLVE